MPEETYIDILIRSLKKKENILDQIQKANQNQRLLLADENLGPDEFEKTVDLKARLIDELNEIDNGFQQIFDKVKPEIEGNMDKYKKEIQLMQDLIRVIVEKTMSVQAEETRNKQLIEHKFSSVKQQIREVKSSQKAVNTYYKNMMKASYVDPQFLDRKK